MELYDAMSTLRAVRKLRPDPIPEDVLQRVLQAATWAPSGGNVQPWRVIAVRDPAKKKAMQPWYAEEWNTYTVHYRERIAHLPKDEKDKMERTLNANFKSIDASLTQLESKDDEPITVAAQSLNALEE